MLNLTWLYSRNQQKHSAFVERVDRYFIVSPAIDPVTGKKCYALHMSTNDFQRQNFIIHGKSVKVLKALTAQCAEKFKSMLDHESENAVYDLEPGETVTCHHCKDAGNSKEYSHGQAFLAGPAHSPFNGGANHICKAHLDADAVIHPLPSSG